MSTAGPRAWIAEPHEAETVAGLLVAFRDHLGKDWPSANAFLAGVERLMDDRDTDFVLGAVDGGADSPPSGVVQLRHRFSVWMAGGDCLVEDIYVRESSRRRGLARAMLTRATTRALERGARRLELDVDETNAPALALYASLGFADHADGQDGRDLYLRRHLPHE